MITRFKLFESEVKIEANSCWTIYGSQSHCVDILNKFKIQFNIESNINVMIRQKEGDIINNNYPDSIGTNIFFMKNSFSYHTFEDENDREIYFKKYNINYKGLMKEEDGKIIFDDLDVYTNKYNL